MERRIQIGLNRRFIRHWGHWRESWVSVMSIDVSGGVIRLVLIVVYNGR